MANALKRLEDSRFNAGGALGAGVLSLLDGAEVLFEAAAGFAFSFPLPKKSLAAVVEEFCEVLESCFVSFGGSFVAGLEEGGGLMDALNVGLGAATGG